MVVALVDVLHRVWWKRLPAVARWLRPAAPVGIPAAEADTERVLEVVAAVAVVAQWARPMLSRSHDASSSRALARAR